MPAPLKETRIKRLAQLMKDRRLSGPAELGRLIGKKTNQTSDLLSGRASFGEKVARDIEEKAGLPYGTLDAPPRDTYWWPFSEELHTEVYALEPDEQLRLENVMRAHLGLPPLHAPPKLSPISGGKYTSDPQPPGAALHEAPAPWGKPAKRNKDAA